MGGVGDTRFAGGLTVEVVRSELRQSLVEGFLDVVQVDRPDLARDLQ